MTFFFLGMVMFFVLLDMEFLSDFYGDYYRKAPCFSTLRLMSA